MPEEKTVIVFTREGRELLAKQHKMLSCERGFMDGEGITLTDEQMLSMITRKPVNLMDRAEAVIDLVLSSVRKGEPAFVLQNLEKIDAVWSELAGMRGKEGRATPKL